MRDSDISREFTKLQKDKDRKQKDPRPKKKEIPQDMDLEVGLDKSPKYEVTNEFDIESDTDWLFRLSLAVL